MHTYTDINTYTFTHLKSFTNSFDMKSIPSGDTLAKDSSSKSYLAMVTFAIVSISVSPIKGDRPEMLCMCNTPDTGQQKPERDRDETNKSITAFADDEG